MIHWLLPSAGSSRVLPPRENRRNRRRNRFGKIPPPRSASSSRSPASCCWPSPLPRAPQDDSAAVEKITKLNKKAVDEFENLNFDQARKILKDALDACSRAGLDSSQIAARTHVHLGVVLFAGFKQKDEALAEFKKALEMAPDVKLDKLLATPEIQEVFDQAVAEQKGEGGGEKAAAGRGRRHHPRAGDPVGAGQGDPNQHDARFVGQGEEGHAVVQRRRVGGLRRARDAGAVARELDGRDPRLGDPGGQGLVLHRGRRRRRPGGRQEGVGRRTAWWSSCAGRAARALGQKKKAAPAPKKEEPEGATWYVGLGVGSGFGWTTGTGEINPADKVKPAGFAPAKLGQVSPEVGYFLSPDLLLSLQVRFQLVSGTTDLHGPGAGSAPSYALAGFARARWLFDAGDVHPFVGALVGGGTIRHVAAFNSVPTCGSSGKQTCVDSMKAGPVFVGGTGGVIYNVTPTFGLTGETNLALGFTNFTFNVDINVGVALEF